MTVDSETMSRMPSASLDQERVEEFAGRLVGVLNDGALALLCHLGHQLGLFDTLAAIGSTTSEGLAEATGLNERYVREWLGGTVVGGIVDHDPVDDTYHLPPEHAASLTRAAGPDNLARVLGFLPVLAQVEQPVTAAFRNGGGVPYTAYETFHSVMADMSDAVFDAALLDVVLPLVDDLPARLTIGAEVADIGCGRGHAVNLMARAYPQSSFVGYDFSEEAIEAARDEAQRLGLTNARFEIQDVAALDTTEVFDVITAFDAIHDQARPARVLERIHQALKPGGTFLMVDTKASSHLQDNHDLPFGPFLYTVSLMHCMTVSLALDGEGLGTVWGRQRALGMLDDAGFTEVEVRELEADPLNLYYITTKP